MNLRFGAVPFDVVQQAAATGQKFLQIDCGRRTPCRIVGELLPYHGLEHEVMVDVVNMAGLTGIDCNRPIEVYSIGYDYYEDPRYTSASHGMAFVQDGQVHNLDLLS